METEKDALALARRLMRLGVELTAEWVKPLGPKSHISADIEALAVSASLAGYFSVVEELVRGRRGLLNTGPVLVAASARGNIDMVEFLIGVGRADVHYDEEAALFEAIYARNVSMVECLIRHGADVNTASLRIPAAAPSAANYWADTRVIGALAQACKVGDVAIVDALIAAGAIVTSHALVAVCVQGGAPIMERLLNAPGETPDWNHFNTACVHGNLEVAKLLAASLPLDYIGKNRTLCSASRAGKLDVVKWLLSIGADIHLNRDNPLRCAVEGGHVELVDFLVSAGASVAAADPVRTTRCLLDDIAISVHFLKLGFSPSTHVCTFHSERKYSPLPEFLLYVVQRQHVYKLSDDYQCRWFRCTVRLKNRLNRWLFRARTRLDTPPRESLGTTRPTRERLIENLRSAGKRFAREYWTEGVPLFFAGMEAELGEVPEEFVHRAKRARAE